MAARPLTRKHLMLAAATCLFAASPAFAAEEVNQAGADKLKQAIEHYIGTKPFDSGAVTLSVKDGAYELRIDPKSVFARMPKVIAADISPFTYRLKPMDDGRYGVTFDQNVTFTYGFDGPQGRINATAAMTDCKSDGIYDPSMFAFATMTMHCGNYSVTQNAPDADTEITIKDFGIELTSKATATGRIDVHMVETIGSLIEDVKGKDAKLPMKLLVTADGIAATMDSRGFVSRPLFDLLALLVAPAGDTPPDQDKVKAALVALLPLWDDTRMEAKIGNMSIDTPVGTFRIKNFTEDVAMSGLTKKAAATIGFGYDGIEMPAIVPAWAQKLTPTKGKIEFGVKDVDVDGLARLAIAKFDPASKPPIPPEAKDEFMKVLLAGAPHFLVNPSTLANGGIDVKFEGDMSLLPTQAGKFTISSAGFEELRLAIANSDMPNKDKTALAITFVKGLAKSGADGRLIWEIEFDSAGPKLIVNGQPMPIGPH